MEINVGEYVRTNLGIGTVHRIYNDIGGYYVRFSKKVIKKWVTITNHSKDITDLIECQDLLYIDISPDNCGGIVVPRIAETQEELNKIISNIKNGVWILKEIVTKEQIKSNAYVLEKER